MQSAGAAEELRPGDGSSPSEQVMLSSGATTVSPQQHAGSCADVSSWLDPQLLGTSVCALATCAVQDGARFGLWQSLSPDGLWAVLSVESRRQGPCCRQVTAEPGRLPASCRDCRRRRRYADHGGASLGGNLRHT